MNFALPDSLVVVLIATHIAALAVGVAIGNALKRRPM